MIDNLFVVESPLQALIALELSLQFKGQKNGIIYRLGGANRCRNNRQIESVVENGSWYFVDKVLTGSRSGLINQLMIKKALNKMSSKYSGQVMQLFIGEFRSQWMHFSRAAVAPKKTILMDDGAATLIIKKNFLDKNIFYPEALFRNKSSIKELAKKIIFYDYLSNCKPFKDRIFMASAFSSLESLYSIDFSEIRRVFQKEQGLLPTQQVAIYFGSKYSESKIISTNYEYNFISKVKHFYANKKVDVIYCAHRDESKKKLEYIEKKLNMKIVSPDYPAEVFLLIENPNLFEVAAAYSSVLNNIKLLLPNIFLRSFEFEYEEINIKNISDIKSIYDYYKSIGIRVE